VTFRLLYHLARADFLERVRRYSFLVTLAAAVYLGYAVAAGRVGVTLGRYGGVANSAWVGLTMAMTTAAFVSLVGFYVVKNAIDRDRQTRVGQIIAGTPVSKLQYALGKAASNFAVLSVIVLVLAVAAVIMQLLGHEESALRLWPLLSPFLLIALPVMAAVAAVAVLFESVPWLSGGFGNVVYVFAWSLPSIVALEAKIRAFDLLAIGFVSETMGAATRARFPDYDGGFVIGAGPKMQSLIRFRWDGLDWTAAGVGYRLLWFGIAFALVLLAALFFDRFDSARAPLLRHGKAGDEKPGPQPARRPAATGASLTPVPAGPGRMRFLAVLLAEVRLMLKGLRWWWYAVAGGFLVAQAANTLDVARHEVLGVSWIWPVLLWSAMGVRETRNGTDQLLFSCSRSLTRQLPALWLSGVVVALLTGGIVGLRLLAAGDLSGLAAWLAGALFVPSLALALGVWSGTSKLFEGLYTTLW
jgi:hypothetical protein